MAEMSNNEAIKKLIEIRESELSYTPETWEVIDKVIESTKECDDLFLKLTGVMHFVDKWIDKGEAEGLDEVQRADFVREKTLQIVEKLEKENASLLEQLKYSTNEAEEYIAKYDGAMNLATMREEENEKLKKQLSNLRIQTFGNDGEEDEWIDVY